jgi:hypothetical protein
VRWLSDQIIQVRRGLRVCTRPRLGAGAIVVQLAAWAVQTLAAYAVLYALNLQGKAGIAAAAAILLAVNVTALVPITPSNIGIFQAATIAAVSRTHWTGWTMWTLSKCCHGKRGDRTAIGSSRDELARGERRMSDGGDAEARRAFAVPVARGSFEGMELAFLDPANEGERTVLIRAEHPELAEAIDRGEEQIEIDGQVMNPRLHLTIHEIVATQLWDNDPPEVWQTARRLLDAGYERHEILHMLGSALATRVWAVLQERSGDDLQSYVRRSGVYPHRGKSSAGADSSPDCGAAARVPTSGGWTSAPLSRTPRRA